MLLGLIDSHPRLGLALWEARWEQDCTGDYPGRQFCEILRHRVSMGACRMCGAPERRHVVTDRMLVGCNTGEVRTTWIYDRACAHGSGLSNYRCPWKQR